MCCNVACKTGLCYDCLASLAEFQGTLISHHYLCYAPNTVDDILHDPSAYTTIWIPLEETCYSQGQCSAASPGPALVAAAAVATPFQPSE